MYVYSVNILLDTSTLIDQLIVKEERHSFVLIGRSHIETLITQKVEHSILLYL